MLGGAANLVIAVAALYRVLARHLYRTRPAADDMPAVTHAIAMENQWRAQRSSVQASFVTRDGPEPVAAVLERLLRQAADDIDALDCAAEVAHCRMPEIDQASPRHDRRYRRRGRALARSRHRRDRRRRANAPSSNPRP